MSGRWGERAGNEGAVALANVPKTCCLSCGYDLDGLEAGLCPECGVEFEWPLPSANGGRSMTWAMGGLGVWFVVYVIVLVQTIVFAITHYLRSVELAIVPLVLGIIATAWMLWRRRSRVAALSQDAQTGLILACWIMPVVVLLIVLHVTEDVRY